jgi:hypothetical protein
LGAQAVAGRDEPRERDAAGKTTALFAYGKTVWSWHPLLMSSQRRFSRIQPGSAKPSIR